MAVRTSIEIALQIGNDTTLEKGLVGDGLISELVDTIDKAGTIVGVLDAGEINVKIVSGNIRLLYIEAEGDIDFYLSGTPATTAAILATGVSYPTSFVGGEVLGLTIDAVTFNVTFLAGDTTLVKILQRINAAAAVNGLDGFIASNSSGQILLVSRTNGSASVVSVAASATATALGLAASTVEGEDPVADTSPVKLRRLADAASSQIETLKSYGLFTALATSLFISNPSDTDEVRYKIITAGDLATLAC